MHKISLRSFRMVVQWLVIGISGVTCGGKTTLAKEITDLLPGISVLSQDDYFYPIDSDKHTLIPELNHFNWEILSSMDMDKMYNDIQAIINNNLYKIDMSTIFKEFKLQKIKTETCKNVINLIKNKLKSENLRILLLEGFSIFNYQPIDQLCQVKFYLTLNKDTCYNRRTSRTYTPADVPGYFENCVWPEHVRHREEVKEISQNVVFLTEDISNKTPVVFQYLELLFRKL